MTYQVTALSSEHLDRLLTQAKLGIQAAELRLAYFSTGSVSYCLLANGEPVMAGGIVNMEWHRGEAWMIPTPFFQKHVFECYKRIKAILPRLAQEGGFKRVQSTSTTSSSKAFFEHLGFEYEGDMRCFGPNGETCRMYARVF